MQPSKLAWPCHNCIMLNKWCGRAHLACKHRQATSPLLKCPQAWYRRPDPSQAQKTEQTHLKTAPVVLNPHSHELLQPYLVMLSICSGSSAPRNIH